MSELENLVADGFRFAISAHNSQPFQFRCVGDSEIEIWTGKKWLLPFADPNNKDLETSLGALFEGLKIFLSKHKRKLSIEKAIIIPKPISDNCKICQFHVEEVGSLRVDELAAQLARRFSYRGAFQVREAETKLLPPIEGTGFRLLFLSDKAIKSRFAKRFDRVNVEYLSNPGYLEELYSWLRFSSKNPRWSFDGLNSQSMSLAWYENSAAQLIMRPKIFGVLNRLGLASILLSEAPKIESSMALVGIVGTKGSAFTAGQGFMRAWLKLAEMNLFGAPLSLLTDDPDSSEWLRTEFSLKPEETIYNVLRVGRLPKSFVPYPAARRPKQELIYNMGS